MARKKKHEEHVNHERWLVSYADFITLLFATFTALFAISNASEEKFKLLAASLKSAFSTEPPNPIPVIGLKNPAFNQTQATGAGSPVSFNQFQSQRRRGRSSGRDRTEAEGLEEAERAESAADAKTEPDAETAQSDSAGGGPGGWMPEFREDIAELIDANQLQQSLNVRKNSKGLVISLSESAFFDPESTYVRGEAASKLDKLVEFLRESDFEIRIEGHSDNSPLVTGRFRDHLELTSLRASRLANFMYMNYDFPPGRITAAGVGSWRPLDTNDTALGRAHNRRVDIVILGPAEDGPPI